MKATLEELIKQRDSELGDVVFGEPWEARLFALALVMVERGHFQWEEFRRSLIAEIAATSKAGTPDGAGYYEAWLRALESVIGTKGIATPAEIERRADFIAAHPPEPTKATTSGPVKVA